MWKDSFNCSQGYGCKQLTKFKKSSLLHSSFAGLLNPNKQQTMNQQNVCILPFVQIKIQTVFIVIYPFPSIKLKKPHIKLNNVNVLFIKFVIFFFINNSIVVKNSNNNNNNKMMLKKTRLSSILCFFFKYQP